MYNFLHFIDGYSFRHIKVSYMANNEQAFYI